ncbi:MAG: ATP-binding cassette domain-containing protein [Dehalococcoidia bacterium]
MTVPAIELRALRKSFGDVHALRGIDLTVSQGEVFGFLGPNGAGKSTLIRILFDLIRPSGGSALVLGCDAQKQGVEARSQMGYVPGEMHLYEGYTAAQLVELFGSLRRQRPDAAYVAELFRRLEVDLTHKVGALSKGNKQKVGLVLSMMQRPPLLVLDEPTSGLDPLVQEEVALLVEELAAAGTTVFFSSHQLSEVERMCHRVAFIRRGELVAVEEIARLKGRSLHILEVTFAQPVPVDAWNIEGVRLVSSEGATVHLEVRSHLDDVLHVLARHAVVDLRTEQPSLEDIFLAYYHGDVSAAEALAAP